MSCFLERKFFLRYIVPINLGPTGSRNKLALPKSHLSPMKYMQITNQAYAVILAGGTLQPVEETRVRLFPGLSLDQVQFFTCKHIVPPESILPIALSRGPSGKAFDFSYNSRNSPSMVSPELLEFLSSWLQFSPNV